MRAISRRGWRRVELGLFALVATFPILPYLVLLVRRGVHRFELVGDLAWIAYDTRHVWSGDTLLGLSSRFPWSHPGPFFFWIVAPFERAFGDAGLHAGAMSVAAISSVAMVVTTRIVSGRSQAVIATFVLLAWLAAFGNSAVNPWGRTVVALPLFAYLALTALFASGKVESAVPAAFVGAVAAQTHVSTAPTVAVVGAVAVIAFFVRARRAGGLTQRARTHLLFAGAFLALVSLPPIIDQLRSSRGNITLLFEFFVHRRQPYQSLSVAVREWMMATAWLPERVAFARLATDGGVAFATRWDEVPGTLSRFELWLAVTHVFALALASVVAWRRRYPTILTILGISILGDVLAIFAIVAIAGSVHYSLLLWATASASLGWVGIFSTAARAVRPSPKARHAMSVAVIGMASWAVSLQQQWLSRFPVPPGTYAFNRDDRAAMYDAVLARAHADGRTPVIHVTGAWTIASAFIAELDRDRAEYFVDEGARWGFPGARSAVGAPRVMHVWFRDPWASPPPSVLQCAQVMRETPTLTVLTSSFDCEEPPTSTPRVAAKEAGQISVSRP